MNAHPHSVESRIGRISLPQRFDRSTTLDLRIPFIRLLVNRNTHHLVIDLSQVDYIDHFGIGTLMAWDKACRVDGKALVLEKCGRRIASLFKRVGVHRSFNFAAAA